MGGKKNRRNGGERREENEGHATWELDGVLMVEPQDALALDKDALAR